MSTLEQGQQLISARAGDQDAFRALTDPHRRELLVHCYRILGSLEDAEDVLQETLVRAWRRLDSFEQRTSLRRWLYKIATNAALDALDRQRRRILPTSIHAPADPRDPLPDPEQYQRWLEPLPDLLIDRRPESNPAVRYELHESVRLAFLTALQSLPGRQRAVLLLRDVIGWAASEVAEALDMSVPAVNSALQRARATMKQHQALPGHELPQHDEQTALLLARYVAAWESADSASLIALLREDAILTMPPLSAWYAGRADISYFLESFLFAGEAATRFRLHATRANGAPAFVVYERDDAGMYRAVAVQILSITLGQVARIDDFLMLPERVLAQFELPLVLNR